MGTHMCQRGTGSQLVENAGVRWVYTRQQRKQLTKGSSMEPKRMHNERMGSSNTA